ncbi:Glutarate-semialdehyde dehydrogenase DavD [Chlamydiales bacterium SCGC AG-110-M15]|nr:Glutarate-semialdehyde dehydrogenase DavD [Chlamydiales bacterium SCGC AG-110-M15]
MEQFLKRDTHGSYISGSFQNQTADKSIDLISPVLNKAWAKLCLAGTSVTQQAIEGSVAAFQTWKMTPPPSRALYLRKLADLLVENKDALAQLITLEMGKTIKEALGEVQYGAGYFNWYAGEAERLYGSLVPSQFPDKRLMVRYESVGVCAAITPWNFPLAMPARKLAPALAAGCTMVLKPSPETPLTALALAYLSREANIPNDVFNVVVGDEEVVGAAMLESNSIRKLTFTGSTQVGRYLYARSADTLKKLSLELGGHAPFIVCDDANLDAAIEGLLSAKLRNNGQACIAPNRVFVHEDIYDDFIDLLSIAVRAIKVGDPRDEKTDVSYILHPESIKKVEKHVEDAIIKGAKPISLGNEVYEPKILADVSPDMLVFNEETFGPVIPITSFSSFGEVVSLANDTGAGLAAYVYSDGMMQAHALVEALEYGIVGVNDGLPSTPQAPFGGVKDSGFGREGGSSGIREYLTEKYISFGFHL